MKPALFGVELDLLGHAMRRKHGDSVRRDLRQILDDTGAARLQRIDHALVVDDLVPDVDGRAVFLERTRDNLDGANHAGAKAAWLRENNLHRMAPLPPSARTGCKAGLRVLNTSNTLATMPSASRPALAYMAAGLSWSMNWSGKTIERTLNPGCSSAPVPARNCNTWEPNPPFVFFLL